MQKSSLTVTRLELYWYEECIGKATGFIYRFGQSIGLVTNWHVFSNKNPINDAWLNSDHKIPNRVHFHLSLYDIDKSSMYFAPYDLPLIIDGESTWWQHYGYVDEEGEPRRVDLAVLSLNEYVPDFDEVKDRVTALSAHMIVHVGANGQPEYVEHGYPVVGADIFILGFPRGLAHQGIVPVWKRGSIASEPLINLQGNLPVFFVDAATRHGMSGSPIIQFGGCITNEKGESIKQEHMDSAVPWLLGVYAGRRGSSDEEAEMALGRGWRRALLDEVFMYRISGNLHPTGRPPEIGSRETV